MKKQMMTALGVLLLGSSVAFASPQPRSNNFNQQQSNQTIAAGPGQQREASPQA